MLFRWKDNTAQMDAARALLVAAKEAFKQKSHAEALDQLRQAEKSASEVGKPADEIRFNALYSAASIFMTDKQFDEAEAALDQATDIITANRWVCSLKHFEVMYYRSKVLFSRGDSAGAMSLLTHAQQELSRRANTPPLHRCLAMIHENAIGVLSSGSRHAELEKWLSVAHEHARQFGHGFPFIWSRFFQAESQLSVREGGVKNQLVRLRLMAGEIEQKIGGSHAAMALVHASFATALQSVGEMDEAEALFEKTRLQLRQESGVVATELVWNGLGMIRLQRQDYAEAEKVFRRLIELPGDRAIVNRSLALNNLGVAIREQGRLSEAEALFRQAIELVELSGSPNGLFHLANATKNLGQNHQSAGRLTEAAECYRSAIDTFARAQTIHDRVKKKLAETESLLSQLSHSVGR